MLTSLAVAANDDGQQQQQQQQQQQMMMIKLGKRKDREIVVSDDEVTIRSKSEPHKSITFTKNYCKKLNSLKHLVRTTVAELHN